MANLLQRLFKRNASLENPSTPLNASTLGNFAISSAGVSVNIDNALSVSPIWRAVRILGETIATIPVKIYRQEGNIKTEDRSHPLYYLFNIEPNRLYGAFNFWETITLHVALHGNSYILIRKNRETAQPRLFEILEPSEIEVVKISSTQLQYRNKKTGQRFTDREVLHFSNTSKNGLIGLSVLNTHATNIGIAIALRDYAANFYKNGAQLSGVLKHPSKLTQDQYTRLKSSWVGQYGGSRNGGKTAILEEGMEYQHIGLKPADAAYSESSKQIISEIARIWGVPTFLLEDLDRATFNNIEHLSQLFLKQTIRPWCKRFASEIIRKCFTREEIAAGYSVEFDFDDLLMADLESRAEYNSKMVNSGIFSINEARENANKNPIENGDNHLVQMNLHTIDKAVTDADLQ